ncbi:hypothetical protein HBB16_13395 [Pseudonocardia sp. MCCB 268]|nr:hypothetical protein [Pseudonocardia cytotoxica]
MHGWRTAACFNHSTCRSPAASGPARHFQSGHDRDFPGLPRRRCPPRRYPALLTDARAAHRRGAWRAARAAVVPADRPQSSSYRRANARRQLDLAPPWSGRTSWAAARLRDRRAGRLLHRERRVRAAHEHRRRALPGWLGDSIDGNGIVEQLTVSAVADVLLKGLASHGGRPSSSAVTADRVRA